MDIHFRDNELPLTHSELRGLLHAIFEEIREFKKEVRNMAEDIKSLDSAVAQEGADVAAVATGLSNLAAAQGTAFADLEAKIAANPTGDFTTEVAALSANHTLLTNSLATITAALAAATAADPGTTTTDAGTGTATTA